MVESYADVPDNFPSFPGKLLDVYAHTRQLHANLLDRLGPLLEKYQIKFLGAWFVLPEHTLYEVFDAPTLESFQQMAMEPEILAWSSFNTMEIKIVATLEDVKRILQS